MLEVLELGSDAKWRTILGGQGGLPPVDGGLPVDTFVSMVTKPTMANTGPRKATTPYVGPGAGATLTITTPNVTYNAINFGTTHVNIKATGVTFNDCEWDNVLAGSLITCTTAGDLKARFNFCSFDNHRQYFTSAAINGHGFTVNRCNFNRMVDSIDCSTTSGNNTADNVVVLDSYFGPMVWQWNAATGVVHPSDNYTHNDQIQHSGGLGMILRGNNFVGYYATDLGTGTPGSGSDQPGGASNAPTYAAGLAARNSILRLNGTKPNDGGPYGGSIADLMFTPIATRGPSAEFVIEFNWFSGGAQMINAGGAGAPANFGRFYGNRFERDSRQVGGAISLKSGAGADIPLSGPNRNIWLPDGGTVNRVNG